MSRVGAPLRLGSTGGMNAGGARVRRPGAATAAAVAALTASLACAGAGGPIGGSDPAAAIEARSGVRMGVDLYESGEFAMAARRFADAANAAYRAADGSLEGRATAAECVAWLRARELAALAECSHRLERLQRRTRRSDPGVNTLIAVGAVAGERPLPRLRIPNGVRPLIVDASKESL